MIQFEPNEQQASMRDALARWLAKEYTTELRKGIRDKSDDGSSKAWQALAEQGYLALPFPEELGGLGGTAYDVAMVQEEFGRALLLEPFLATVVCREPLLAMHDAHQAGEWVGRVVAGDLCVAWADDESNARNAVPATATRSRDGWTVSGGKSPVLHGGSAGLLLVTAHDEISTKSRVFAVEAQGKGVSRRRYRLQDGTEAADVTLDRAHARALTDAGDDAELIIRARQAGAAAVCSEAVGVMARLLETTVEYLKTRKQFGRHLWDNQVLQHRCVDMAIRVEKAKAMSTLAAAAMSPGADAGERAHLIAIAKYAVGDAARFVGQQAIQLHGAIGLTEDYMIGDYCRRLVVLEQLFGDREYQLALVMRRRYPH